MTVTAPATNNDSFELKWRGADLAIGHEIEVTPPERGGNEIGVETMRKILSGVLLGTLMTIAFPSFVRAEGSFCSDFCKDGQPLFEKDTNGSASYCALDGSTARGCYIGSAPNHRCDNHPTIKLCSVSDSPEDPDEAEEDIKDLRAAVVENLLSLEGALNELLPAVQAEGVRKTANAIKAFQREMKKFRRKAGLN